MNIKYIKTFCLSWLLLIISCSTTPITEPPLTSVYSIPNASGKLITIFEHRGTPREIGRYCERLFNGLMCARKYHNRWHIYVSTEEYGEWLKHEQRHALEDGSFHY